MCCRRLPLQPERRWPSLQNSLHRIQQDEVLVQTAAIRSTRFTGDAPPAASRAFQHSGARLVTARVSALNEFDASLEQPERAAPQPPDILHKPDHFQA
jgi:hypothetical protein